MAPSSSSRKKFKYTDDELLRLFLYNKIHGKPLPDNDIILEYDLYGERNPWEIWEEFGDSHSYGGKDIYFFTKLKKKSGSSGRSARTIGLGSWEGEASATPIVDTNDPNKPQLVGMRKRFRFEKSGTNQDGKWIMHEWRLDSTLVSDSSAKNYVLCRFRKNFRQNHPKKNASNKKKKTMGSASKQEMEININKKRKVMVLGLEATPESDTKNNDNAVLPRKIICNEPKRRPRSEEIIKDMGKSGNKVLIGKNICEQPKSHAESRDKIEDINHNNNNKVISLSKDICQEQKSHPESGDKTKVIETTIGTGSEDRDLTMSWPELFALQLSEGSSIQEEEIHMLPNTCYKDLLLENIDKNFIHTNNK